MSSITSSCFVILVSIYIFLHVESVKECNNLGQCRERSINNDRVHCSAKLACSRNANITATDGLDCAAYKTCQRSTLQSPRWVICSGEQSCTDAKSINTYTVICSGSSSCYEAKSITTKRYSICSGANSCSRSIALSSAEDIICGGVQSCQSVNRIRLSMSKYTLFLF